MPKRTPPLTDSVVAAFGGVSALSHALGHRSCSTVHSWKSSGRIPAWRFAEIRAAARRTGIELPVAFPPEAEAA